MSEIRISVNHKGQRYVDMPQFYYLRDRLHAAIASIHGRRVPERVVVGFERIWLKQGKP